MAILRPLRVVAATLLVLAVAAEPLLAAGVAEDDVKAAFLYNFAKYIEWPESAFPSGTFQLCVVADAAFVKRVDEILAGEAVEGHQVVRRTPAGVEDARACHILFLRQVEAVQMDEWLASVATSPVLTVGDSSEFLARGGAVAFVRDGDRVRFDINVRSAQLGGLTISSRLLRVARRVVQPAPGR
ncbi:MAG: YfiR family protein [Acidobacteriota bacterium]